MHPPDSLRIAYVVERTEAEGPGTRFAVWVQGCHIRCAGCCNPHLFDPGGGRATPVEELVGRVASTREGLDGVSFLGGEPFEQAAALAVLARGARQFGLGIMTFTGHAIEHLRASHDSGIAALLATTDLLVDGPYDASRPERERLWAGSTNQRFHFLTNRYRPGIERIVPGGVERTVELRIGSDGAAIVNGWPELRRPLR